MRAALPRARGGLVYWPHSREGTRACVDRYVQPSRAGGSAVKSGTGSSSSLGMILARGSTAEGEAPEEAERARVLMRSGSC